MKKQAGRVVLQLPSVTIVRLGADVVGSSPAARQFFFICIYIYKQNEEGSIYLSMSKNLRRARASIEP